MAAIGFNTGSAGDYEGGTIRAKEISERLWADDEEEE